MDVTITAAIPYTLDNGEMLVNESFGPKNIHGHRTGTVERKTMTVLNGRGLAERLSLDDQGLVFVEHKTQVEDFFDEEQVRTVYYPEIEQLIKSQSGASRVVIFDHALRSGDEPSESKGLFERRFCRHTTTTRNGPDPTGCAKFCQMRRMIYSRIASRSSKCGAPSIVPSNRIPWRLPMPEALRLTISWWRRVAIHTGLARLIGSNITRIIVGFTFPKCAATKRSCLKFMTQTKIAPGSRPTHRSTIQQLRPMPRQGRASRYVLSRFLHRNE